MIRQSNATLINGKGRYLTGPPSDLAVIRAQPGMRHRMRFVNIGCDQFFDISIDNHKMTIIEVDGLETEPYEVDQFRIHSAQRVSVVVNMDQDIDNYCTSFCPSVVAAAYVSPSQGSVPTQVFPTLRLEESILPSFAMMVLLLQNLWTAIATQVWVL